MKILSNSHTVDWKIAEMILGWTVGIETTGGDCFDMKVDVIVPDDFVTLVGPRVTYADEFDFVEGTDPTIHETRRVKMVEIETLEIFLMGAP